MLRRLSFSASVCTLLLLAACASPPPQPTGPAPAEVRVIERIDQLQYALLASCDFNAVRSRAELAAVSDLRDRMQHLQGGVRNLRGEIANAAQRTAALEQRPSPLVTSTAIGDKLMLGRAEWIGLPTLGSYFKARLDTGANTSSLSAEEVTPFERDGQNWVRFRLALDEDDIVVSEARDREFEARIVRRVRIVQASGSETRPVIRLPLTLGALEQNVEFTLNDRTHLTYPVLLGRRFMMDQAVIDVSRTYTVPRPEFPGGEPAAAATKDQDDNDQAED